MKGSEFIKRVKKLAKAKSVTFKLDASRGKGSHMTLYYDNSHTIIRNPKDELKTGTLKAMLDQLGIDKSEI